MKTKKRKKVTRARGTHTQGTGFKKKGRGKGHRGGVGMAGTGKRADQKKTLILKSKKYFGKVIRRAAPAPTKFETINLREIQNKIKKDQKEIKFPGYKILGTGEITSKVKIFASAASKSAIDKVKKAGGDIILE